MYESNTTPSWNTESETIWDGILKAGTSTHLFLTHWVSEVRIQPVVQTIIGWDVSICYSGNIWTLFGKKICLVLYVYA